MDKDVLTMIVSHVVDGIDDIRDLRLVSRFFNKTLSDPLAWRYFPNMEVKSDIDTLISNVGTVKSPHDHLDWYHGHINISLSVADMDKLALLPRRHQQKYV